MTLGISKTPLDLPVRRVQSPLTAAERAMRNGCRPVAPAVETHTDRIAPPRREDEVHLSSSWEAFGPIGATKMGIAR